ncbi:MAG TPA: hypothetical protein PLN15_03720 [Bacilli bacterium]|nr:hypothetical protein [Bacilli bacterium]
MKKTTVALTIAALIALVLGIVIFVVEPFLNPGIYSFAGFFADSWAQIYLWFSFLGNPTYDVLRIIMLSAIGVFGLVLPIIWIVLMAKYNKPKSALVLISWYLILAVSVFDVAFLLGAPQFITDVLTPSDLLTSILLWATHGFIALALILILVAGIINMVYCANAPTPPKRTFSNASGNDERLVLIREEPQPNAPSADEIREVLHDELENAPAPAAKPEAPASPVHTVNTQPGISGPLLVQYINTYGPPAQPQAAPAPQQNLYPPYPFLASCPCARGNFVPCMQAGYCPCMKEGKFPCLESHSVAVEPKKEEVKEEPKVQPSAGYEAVKEEPAKHEEVNLDKIKEIMHGELGSTAVEAPVVKEEPKAPAPAVVQVGPSLEEIRAMVREELSVEEAEKPAPAPIIVAVPAPAPAPVPVKEEPVEKPLDANQIRQLIADELAKLIVKAEPEPEPEPVKEEELSEDKVRAVIAEELARVMVKPEPEPEPAPAPEVKPVTAEEMRQIMLEAVAQMAAAKPEPAPAPVVQPAPVVVEPAPVIVKVEKTAPVKVAAQPAEEDKEKPTYERIPFQTRMLKADKEMKNNYNELKSEIMSYGVKSRVSNSGDTFRLHTKTYLKITIAGKSLKLYYALDPKDYEKTTLPVQDAGHKGIYKDIPLVFKVKSDLSMRRAKQLIADTMEKSGLEQGKIELHNWVKEIKE